MPPKVPPKSPRTKIWASPRAHFMKTLHSANSCVSTILNATSATSSTSFNSWNDNCSPRSLGTPILNESPSNKPRGMDNIVSRTGPLPSRNNSPSGQPRLVDNAGSKTHPYAQADGPSRELRGHKHLENVAPPTVRSNKSPALPSESFEPQSSTLSAKDEILRGEPRPAKPMHMTLYHQRDHSEPSQVSPPPPRRPLLVRADITSIHELLQTIVRSPMYQYGNMNLPSGFRAIDATANVPPAEVKALKQQAGKQVERFEVLQGKDVSMLCQELELLDGRCSYLQSTHRSLRQGRRNLLIRMITYLKSRRMGNCPRDSILKQEDALAELDVSIDDWVSKLEAAEERRTRIRRILLEHIAAAVTLHTGAKAEIENQAPSISPEDEDEDDDDDDYISTERRGVQSIKIYADEGVAALLAGIEKESTPWPILE